MGNCMKQLVLFCGLFILLVNATFAQKRADSLLVFVGERIEVKKFKPTLAEGQIAFDEAFKARYKVIQPVYGRYPADTIDFIAYDHMGDPAFAKFKYVLLFLSYYKGQLYHEKYQYFDVYPTKSGKWASCGDPYKFDDYHRKAVKAVKLAFAKPISFDLSTLDAERIKQMYPEPYFVIKDNRAICVMGAYVNELFQVKKEGVLKARGIFD